MKNTRIQEFYRQYLGLPTAALHQILLCCNHHIKSDGLGLFCTLFSQNITNKPAWRVFRRHYKTFPSKTRQWRTIIPHAKCRVSTTNAMYVPGAATWIPVRSLTNSDKLLQLATRTAPDARRHPRNTSSTTDDEAVTLHGVRLRNPWQTYVMDMYRTCCG